MPCCCMGECTWSWVRGGDGGMGRFGSMYSAPSVRCCGSGDAVLGRGLSESSLAASSNSGVGGLDGALAGGLVGGGVGWCRRCGIGSL